MQSQGGTSQLRPTNVIRDESDYLRAEGAALAAGHRYADAVATLVQAGSAVQPDLADVRPRLTHLRALVERQ